jgi:aryl-alcohol dehydrogenase-like predicted oxidoreductase
MLKQKYVQLTLFVLLLCSLIPLQAASAEMPYVQLCETPGRCKRISRLILGTDHLGKIPPAETEAVLNEALRLGINAFDTAPIYTDDIERRLGDWLKKQKRQDLHVITKGGFPHDLGPGTYRSRLNGTAVDITTAIREEILPSRARFDQPISIYLMHRDDADFNAYQRVSRPQTPVDTILTALSEPTLRKHFEFLGVSNWSSERINASQQLANRRPELVRPVCSSPYFSLLEMGAVTIHSGGVQVTHTDMMKADFQAGVKLMPYSPLGGFSILSRGWEPARQQALKLKQQKDRYWGNVYAAIFHEANRQRYQRAEAFLARFNRQHRRAYTLDQLFNAYVLAHRRTDFMVIGPRSKAQLQRTVASLELAQQLTPADLDYLYSGRGPGASQPG